MYCPGRRWRSRDRDIPARSRHRTGPDISRTGVQRTRATEVTSTGTRATQPEVSKTRDTEPEVYRTRATELRALEPDVSRTRNIEQGLYRTRASEHLTCRAK
ncbi:hypothetical protein GDO81_019794 [Engystomops pustulosus]|uniref:MHC class I antigen n=1 Tax=Engystomops pustulosus TaxID=76066 RepID=A0AAV6ZTZ5_ENGPU|nr:hypothetical protein GDO81_019794 [Engystomops pustulosus]